MATLSLTPVTYDAEYGSRITPLRMVDLLYVRLLPFVANESDPDTISRRSSLPEITLTKHEDHDKRVLGAIILSEPQRIFH